MEPFIEMSRPGSLGECMSDWYSESHGFDPPIRQNFFVEIGHEMISTAILSLPLIQVGQLVVSYRRKDVH